MHFFQQEIEASRTEIGDDGEIMYDLIVFFDVKSFISLGDDDETPCQHIVVSLGMNRIFAFVNNCGLCHSFHSRIIQEPSSILLLFLNITRRREAPIFDAPLVGVC